MKEPADKEGIGCLFVIVFLWLFVLVFCVERHRHRIDELWKQVDILREQVRVAVPK